jgi:nicotinate dehydrogenase subunit B
MINPDAVRAQVEGCILQTLSRTWFEEVTFDRSRVTSTDWASYPILTFPDVPQLDIALIDRRRRIFHLTLKDCFRAATDVCLKLPDQ